MDDNTFKAVLAFIAMLQVVILGYFGYQQNRAKTHIKDTQVKLEAVKELVNGLSTARTASAVEAATAQGELAGRDFMRNADTERRTEDTQRRAEDKERRIEDRQRFEPLTPAPGVNPTELED
jgi:hypothetical protein